VWHPAEGDRRSYGFVMTPVTRPRGPLPARVYWTRRLLVVALAFGLVFAIAQLLGHRSNGGPAAQPVGATASSPASTSAARTTGSLPVATDSAGAPGAKVGKKARTRAGTKGSAKPSPTPLATPTGPCQASDLVARPSLTGPAYAGKPVVFTMTLTTKVTPACTWNVAPTSLAVKVTSGSDRIWSSQECATALPEQAVVVRKDHPALVSVTWHGQRSDAECTRSTPWAEPGFYHVTAAAFGAEPVDQQFQLQAPPPRTITATPTPERTKAAEPRR
jgi:hypothetical protein